MKYRAFGLLLACLLLAGCALFPHPHQEELRAAYERYAETWQEAELTLDTSRLAEVATGEVLELAILSIEQRTDFTELISEEFEIVWVQVLDYSPTRATIEVKKKYRGFSQDFQTGKRYYGLTDRWYWRITRVTLVQEDGAWKVQDIDFVSWSG
jgi:hypothetical protein